MTRHDFIHPTISHRALEKATLTLQPFVRLYFPFYGLSDRDFLNHLCLFVYTEATIYQIDEEYEINIGKSDFFSDHWQILINILKDRLFFDDFLAEELKNGMSYYGLERRLCTSNSFSFEDIVQANRCKCYDFRVLHRLLYKIQNRSYDESILNAFWWGERLVDVEDDIKQYHDDVSRNVYNTYRMIVKLYGEQGREELQQYIDYLDGQFHANIAQLPPEPRHGLLKIWETYRQDSPIPLIPEPTVT